MTDAERTDHEATEAEFMRRHPDCHAGRWSMSGSRTIHCVFCCPPPPLSDKQISQIRAILTGTGSSDPADLDTWRLTLTCRNAILDAIDRLHRLAGATEFVRRDIVAEVQAAGAAFERQTIYRCLRRMTGGESGSAYHDLDDLGGDRLRLRA